jgi:hypothetical protein
MAQGDIHFCWMGDGGVRKLIFLAVCMVLPGCDTSTTPNADSRDIEAAEMKKQEAEKLKAANELRERNDIAAIQAGKQACPGKVLKRKELLKYVVNNKIHRGFNPESGISFYKDGTFVEFEVHHWDQTKYKSIKGNYYIDKYDRVCLFYSKDKIYCGRYIGSHRRFARESSPNSKFPCLSIDIDDFGARI